MHTEPYNIYPNGTRKRLNSLLVKRSRNPKLELEPPAVLALSQQFLPFSKTKAKGIIQHKTYHPHLLLSIALFKDPSKLKTTLSIGDSKLAI